MIKNEKQYKISRKKLKEVSAQIEQIEKDNTQNPLRNELMLVSLNSLKSEIAYDLSQYESLKKNKKGVLKERRIAELPSLLIEYKIISGMTQKEFSEKLGLKEQQLQRYEADNFKGVTFKNLLKYLDSIGLEIRIKETRLNKNRQKSSKRKSQPKD